MDKVKTQLGRGASWLLDRLIGQSAFPVGGVLDYGWDIAREGEGEGTKGDRA